MTPESTYLIALIKAMLQKTDVPEKPADVDFDKLYRLAKLHCVESIAFYAIETLDQQPEPALRKKWQQNRDGNLVKGMNQMAELEALSQAFSSQGIDHLPLKGAILLDLYPQFDYRYLGDLDILVRKSDWDKASKLLINLGYQLEGVFNGYHQEYVKNLGNFSIHVELHDDLLAEDSPHRSAFDNIWEKLTPMTENGHRYQMSPELFYSHLMVHLAKHYYGDGSGIRSLMDIAVYLKAYEGQLEHKAIDSILADVDLLDFKIQIQRLATAWFGDGVLDADLDKLANHIISSGAYGTLDKRIENALEQVKNSKSRYAFNRLFLSPKKLKYAYPILQKYPYLLPYFWGQRAVEIILTPDRRQRLVEEGKRLIRLKRS